jgi:hypothetical protein
MKKLLVVFILIFSMSSCHFDKNLIPQESKTSNKKESDTIRIANDSLQYEVIIIDPGFNSWLASRARPRGFYSESFLENHNQIYAVEWNSRVLQPQRFSPNLYEMQINYDANIHYGYEVNYLIYNYFVFFQITNKQALSGFVPRP